jgi:sirohydrochlorin ferrochelatase
MTALIVFAHGSSVESANESVRITARELASATGSMVEAAFLEGGVPDLSGAIANCAAQGANRALVLPYFLTLGLHLQRDLPRLVEQARIANPGISIEVAQPLDGHPGLVAALKDRAAEVA